MQALIPIENDLFSIGERLKEIDPRYLLYRNAKEGRFEVYIGEALQFVVPFPCLDARTVEYARKTRIERIDEILNEMDKSNNLLEERRDKDSIDLALAQAGF